MALPLYLAMTPGEMATKYPLPDKLAWMACHFSPYSQGLSNIPEALNPGCILILNDNLPCQGHSADLVTGQLKDILARFQCKSLLLDFQRPPEEESTAMVTSILQSITLPVAVSEGYAEGLTCPVFLPPWPLHLTAEGALSRWKGREIWLEAALCQETVTITEKGCTVSSQFPPEQLEGGFYDEDLCCHYRTEVLENEIRFTLFDTRESLPRKLEKARSLGVTRAVGLYQQLGA